MPNAKFALFYQNDDFGKNFVNGLRDVLGDRYSSTAQAVAYELTDPTVDSQVVTLPRPPAIADNRSEGTAMTMRHAQFVSAKRLAVVTIDIFALTPILCASTGDAG
jgi:hypothetical protein